MGAAATPSVLKIFGLNAYDSGKNTLDKISKEFGFYNTTKWSILKGFNAAAVNLLIAGNC